MDYIELETKDKIPLIGYGTWTLHDDECRYCVAKAIECGYTLIDTARMYNNEKAVGYGIKDSGIKREDLFVTTKLFTDSLSFDKAWDNLLDSMDKLSLDYLDLVLVHEPYDESDEMYEAICEAYEKGIVKNVGISNFNKKRYDDFIGKHNIIPHINQVDSSVFFPRFELMRYMKEMGTVMQGWAPFSEGMQGIFENEILTSVGKKYGKTPAQIALKYLVQNGIATIPKTKNEKRMKENLDIFDFTLDTTDLNNIHSLNGDKSPFDWCE